MSLPLAKLRLRIALLLATAFLLIVGLATHLELFYEQDRAFVSLMLLLSAPALWWAGYRFVWQPVDRLSETARAIRLQAAAFESTPNAIVITDRSGQILWVNSAFSTLTGYTREEAIGQNPRLLKSGCQDEAFYRSLWETICAGNTWRGEIVNRRKDGTQFTEEMVIAPVPSATGEISQFIAVKQDVSDRKAAAESLRVSEERFRLAFLNGPVGIFFVGLDLRFIRVNRALCEMLGYAETELLDRTVSDITHPSNRRQERELAQRILSGDIPAHKSETRYVTKSGTYLDVEVTANLIRGQDGAPFYALGIVENITERKRAEQQLLQKTRGLEAVFQSLPDLYFRLRLDGTVLDYLSGPKRELYLLPEQFLGKRMQTVLPEEVGRQFEQALHDLERGSTPVSFEYRLSVGGREHFYEARLSRLHDDEIVALVHDSTERHRLQEQLRQAQKMEAVGRLAGGIAHDFNNMLGVIIGYAQLLQEQLSHQTTASRYIGEVKKAADRAAALTRQLLAFSRKQVLRPRPLDLNTVIHELSFMLRRMIGADIELVIRPGAALGAVTADPSQLEQVLMNLAVNARDAMPNGGKLVIETANVDLDDEFAQAHQPTVPGPYVMLAVTDSGHGMDAATQAHIFEPFFTTKEAGKGTGLGLSTVYGIVKQSGGYIWVSSAPDEGATFTIYLPRTDKALASPVLQEVNVSRPATGATILLVEDEEPLRELTRVVLEQEGFTVLAAKDGAEALEISAARNQRIDLLLTDVVLPGLSGRDVAQKMTTLQPDIKTIYMSGYNDELMAQKGVVGWDMALIEKPFTKQSLLNKIFEVLSTKARGAAG